MSRPSGSWRAFLLRRTRRAGLLHRQRTRHDRGDSGRPAHDGLLLSALPVETGGVLRRRRQVTDARANTLVRTVFNGSWLPRRSEETVAEAQRIISGVIGRLRISVRGYLTLMTVDATVYPPLDSTCWEFPTSGARPAGGVRHSAALHRPDSLGDADVLVTLAVGGGDVSRRAVGRNHRSLSGLQRHHRTVHSVSSGDWGIARIDHAGDDHRGVARRDFRRNSRHDSRAPRRRR